MKLNLPKRKSFTGNASILKRIIAFIVDFLILDFFVLGPFRKIFANIIPSSDFKEAYDFLLNNTMETAALRISLVFMTILIILYFSILEYKTGQSVGKMILNIYVNGEKKELRYWQCVVRSMFFIPFFPFVLLWIIDPVYLFFNKNHQRLTEVISKTRVVERYEYG